MLFSTLLMAARLERLVSIKQKNIKFDCHYERGLERSRRLLEFCEFICPFLFLTVTGWLQDSWGSSAYGGRGNTQSYWYVRLSGRWGNGGNWKSPFLLLRITQTMYLLSITSVIFNLQSKYMKFIYLSWALKRPFKGMVVATFSAT